MFVFTLFWWFGCLVFWLLALTVLVWVAMVEFVLS